MKPDTNMFGQKICIREECPAFFSTEDEYGGCAAKLDHHGRLPSGGGFGMLCGLPIEFGISRRRRRTIKIEINKYGYTTIGEYSGNELVSESGYSYNTPRDTIISDLKSMIDMNR